jgi:hypothetical protein
MRRREVLLLLPILLYNHFINIEVVSFSKSKMSAFAKISPEGDRVQELGDDNFFKFIG